MMPKHISNATRVLGKPTDWDDDANGQCVGLPILDYQDPATQINYMISMWEPTPEELKALNAGAAVKLWVCGVQHPVVAVGVGEIAE